jgi:hypothetical protein
MERKGEWMTKRANKRFYQTYSVGVVQSTADLLEKVYDAINRERLNANLTTIGKADAFARVVKDAADHWQVRV